MICRDLFTLLANYRRKYPLDFSFLCIMKRSFVNRILTEQFTECISHDTSVVIDSWAQIDLDFHAYLDGTQLSARTLEPQLPPLKKQRYELKCLAHYPLGLSAVYVITRCSLASL